MLNDITRQWEHNSWMTHITSVYASMFISLFLWLQSLSRLTRVVPAVFLAVIDTCGPAAILEGMSGAGARVQQHLLTAMATALLTSRIQTQRVTQSKVRVYSYAHLHKNVGIYCRMSKANTYRLHINWTKKPRHKQPYCFTVRFYWCCQREIPQEI